MLEQINIAMRKVSAPTLRAGLIKNANILDTLNQYFENDQAYAFMNSIKDALLHIGKNSGQKY